MLVNKLVYHCGLIVFLISLGFHVHGLGFRFAFLEDNLGFGFARRTRGSGAAISLKCQTLFFRFGQSLDALPLDFRVFQNGRNQLALSPLNLRVLNRDLAFLLDSLNFDLLGDHLLLHHVSLQFVGFIGRGLLPLDGFLEVSFFDL